jgi:hypothetical protein
MTIHNKNGNQGVSGQADCLAYHLNHKLLKERGASYADLAEAYDAPLGGRFATEARKVGELPAPNWAGQDNAVEPPLGYDISYVEPCGELHEQREAARLLREAQRSATLPSEDPASSAPSASDVKPQLAGSTSIRRRI